MALDDFMDAYAPSEDTVETVGKSLLGAAVAAGAVKTAGNLGYSSIPTGVGRDVANHAMNYLDGFYKKGANKNLLYMQELAKTSGRLFKTALNPREAITYGHTGVSKLVTDNINNMRDELAKVDTDFIDGKYGGKLDKKGNLQYKSAVESANQAKGKIVKMAHYKVLNDAANTNIFGGKVSKILNDYNKRIGASKTAKPYFVKSNADDFLKTAARGNVDRANYIVSRHRVGHANLPGATQINKFLDKVGMSKKKLKSKGLSMDNKNLRFLKWTDNNLSGVLRGAQFNYKTYEMLSDVSKMAKRKQHGKGVFDKALQMISGNDAAKNVKWIKNNQGQRVLLFNFSPVMKGNYDWGGYNVVAEYNPRKPDRIRFIGTDLRDTPISSAFKGKHVMNYVESRGFDIKEIVEEGHIDEDTIPKKTKTTKKKTAADIIKEQNRKKAIMNLPENRNLRLQMVKDGNIKLTPLKKGVVEKLEDIVTRKERVRKKVTLTNASKKMRRNILKYGKYAGKAGGAVGLGLLGAALAGSIFYDIVRGE